MIAWSLCLFHYFLLTYFFSIILLCYGIMLFKSYCVQSWMQSTCVGRYQLLFEKFRLYFSFQSRFRRFVWGLVAVYWQLIDFKCNVCHRQSYLNKYWVELALITKDLLFQFKNGIIFKPLTLNFGVGERRNS